MTTTVDRPLRIGMVGYSFMGAAHSQAWRNAPSFFDLPMRPEMAAICGRNATAAMEVAGRFGWQSVETDWHALLTRPDIDLVDICSPGNTHAEIAIAALEAGKHVLCEKPLANSVDEAEAMTAAAEKAAEAGVRSMVGFTYRRVPAIGLAQRLVAKGRIGTVRNVRAQYLQDWIVDPQAPLFWRLRREVAGSGALGDIGAHIVDLVQFMTGEAITGLSALTATFIKERPLPESTSGLSGTSGTEMGEVTVDDAAVFISTLSGGGLATFEATRFATGRKNAIRIEINGSEGSVAFDFEDMNILHFYDNNDDSEIAGFRRILVTEPVHPYVKAWWPAGHLIGYEHGFTHQVVDLVEDIAQGRAPRPSFADGLRVQRILDAVEKSAADKSTWMEIPS
ncbi:MAG: Gfo/Idh/MocA family oxidoreductase [Actinomycetota bacterium]|nr:Gfo/Idh/MocA family oxidoreductase [Actinomycetota bacterium]